MLHRPKPAEAYRRVELDACVAGGNPAQMTRLCIAEAIGALNRSLYFESRGNDESCRNCLLKAISAMQALQLGVDREQPLGDVLLTFYGNACQGVSRNLRNFDAEAIAAIRGDLLDIDQAFGAAQA